MSEMQKWLRNYLDRLLIDEEGIWTYEDIPTDWGNLLEYDIFRELAPEIQSQDDCQLIEGLLEKLATDATQALQGYSKNVKEEFRRIKLASCTICQQAPIAETTLRICRSCQKQYMTEAQKVKIHLYRARRVGAPATLTLAEWLTTLKRFEYKCAYCQQNPYEVLEHYIPLPRQPTKERNAQGGTTTTNCIPSCRSCNTEKGGRQP